VAHPTRATRPVPGFRVRGRLLGPDGDDEAELYVDGAGLFVEGPLPGAQTLVDAGFLVPGLVDAHCHVGLGPDGPVPLSECVTQAQTDRDAGTLLIRDCGSPVDTRPLRERADLPEIIRAGRHLGRPKRFVNMLRVAKPTSPMSMGSWLLAAYAPAGAWKRRSCGDGAKGPRVYDWAVASLPGGQDGAPPGWTRYLLVRRSLTRNARGELELAYYLCCAPAGTSDEDLITVAGSRWAVEECFQTAKTETGLDQYQVRRYDAWYRHVTLAMLAHAYLSVTAATAPKALAAASSRSRSARSAVSWHT